MDALLFRFQGGLSDNNRMDFYESSRFQYAAARLSVKLDQFRRTGHFPKRVTTASRTNIDLHAYEMGSFRLKISSEDSGEDEYHVRVPLTALWTYVIERVFQPIETSAALDLIDDNALRAEFFQLVERNVFDANAAIELFRERLSKSGQLTSTELGLLQRLISEVERRAYLKSHRDLLGQISPAEDAALVTMATPLLSEIAVPLRRSAKLVTISTIDKLGERSILTTDKKTADALDSIKIDKSVVSIDVNIVQYNKETGWGKFRNPNWTGIPSFSIPADRKENLKFNLLHAMHEDQVSVDAYIVRSLSGEPMRLIIVDLNYIEERNEF